MFYIGDHGAQFPRGQGHCIRRRLARADDCALAEKRYAQSSSQRTGLDTGLAAHGASRCRHRGAYKTIGPRVAAVVHKIAATPVAQVHFRLYDGFVSPAPASCSIRFATERYKLISNPRPGTVNLDAGTYLDESHQHFVVSGATAKDQATAPDFVRSAFARWSRPPRYELYDLKGDPHQWRDLADNPAHAEVKARLISALTDWQQRTRDPFADRANVDAFVAEQLVNRDLAYRKQKNFRWSYLDTFKKWRENPVDASIPEKD